LIEKSDSLRVGYVPYSQDLQHPADRRRLAVWAAGRKTELNIADPSNSDILVLSSAANFGYWLKHVKQPVILDLVDGYLGENPSFVKDLARNIVRSFRGTSNFHWITYTRHLRKACQMSDAIIVASPEQRDLVLPLNGNVYVILDDHSEFETVLSTAVSSASSTVKLSHVPHIIWEGFGFTLKHFRFMAEELDQFLQEYKWGMYLVTVEEFPRWGGYIGKVKTRKLIRKMFPLSWQAIEIIPWSVENLTTYAKKSDFGIIPIDPTDKFASFKSENKLLSMWHLHLPVVFSHTLSYSRVARAAEIESATVEPDSWGRALREISAAPAALNMLRNRGFDYVQKTHTREILIDKWSIALSKTMMKVKR
jgi:hypothetical protein